MPSVRSYPLAALVVAVLATGCAQGSQHPAAAAHAAPVAVTVAAHVQAHPVPVQVAAHAARQPAAHLPARVRATRAASSATVRHAKAVKAARTTTPTTAQTTQASASSVAPVAAPPARTAGYPYASDSTGGLDAWGFTRRQCVSYVAWRLAQAGAALSNPRDGWGSAYNWDETARRLGRKVGSTPFVGAVAQWNAGESSAVYAPGSSRPGGRFTAGGYGHVGYVTAVYADGSVQVAQYNVTDDRSYSSMRMVAPRYL